MPSQPVWLYQGDQRGKIITQWILLVKRGTKISLQEWWISLGKFTKDLTGTVAAANLCLWELLQVNQPALHRIHSQGIVRFVLLQLCTKTRHVAIIHWTHFIIVFISRLASLTCWQQLSRPPCLFATLEQTSLPLCHSWADLPASLPLLSRPPYLFATLEQTSLPLCHSWADLPASLPLLSRPPYLFATLEQTSLPLCHSWADLPTSLPLLSRSPYLFATLAMHTRMHTCAHTFFHCAACFLFSFFTTGQTNWLLILFPVYAHLIL